MRYLLGIFFLVLGIIGVIFPIIPGIPFLVIAGFLFGFLNEKQILKFLKRFKNEDKNSKINKLINYAIIKYIHKRTAASNGK